MRVITNSNKSKFVGEKIKYQFISKIGKPIDSKKLCIKRMVDVVFGIIFLIISLPILFVFGILTKMTSEGPIFYKQERVGLSGKTFMVIKLRSMRTGAEDKTGAVWAEKDDPRVTNVGRFMRRTRIDELPQFINVILGDMSLIGPRPERPNFTESFTRDIPYFSRRLRVKPGITGYAQVHGGYDISPGEKAKLDNFYIEHMSMSMDLRIIWDTLKVIFSGDGAR